MRLLRIALVSALLLGLFVPMSAHAKAPDYVAVIDAGSSGTRIALFTLPGKGKLAPASVFEFEGDDSGLDDYADRPSAAGTEVVAPLLTALAPALASRGLAPAGVPVSLLATAGLRGLQTSDPDAVRRIFASARGAIVAAGHPARRVTVMSGQHEAMYAWIDANALLADAGGVFGRIGIAEVGGASAQIAFATGRDTAKATTTARVGGRDYPLVAISYLGLGVNEARSAMARTGAGPRPCYPNSAPGAEPTVYTVAGDRTVSASRSDFAYAVCSRTYRTVIRKVGADAHNGGETGGVAPYEVRRLPGFAEASFVGVSAVVFSLQGFGVPESRNESARLRRSVRTTCTGPNAWPRVVARYKGDTGPFAQVACSTATYLNAWIFGEVGLGIRSDRFSQGDVLNGESPSWSSGYALSQLDP